MSFATFFAEIAQIELFCGLCAITGIGLWKAAIALKLSFKSSLTYSKRPLYLSSPDFLYLMLGMSPAVVAISALKFWYFHNISFP